MAWRHLIFLSREGGRVLDFDDCAERTRRKQPKLKSRERVVKLNHFSKSSSLASALPACPTSTFTAIEVRKSLDVSPVATLRPSVRGKFIFLGEEKFYIRGVTYGTFRPDEKGDEFPVPEMVERDFSLMEANGINAVRTYTPPPGWLLDAAQRHRLRVMVGLAVERSAAFIDYADCCQSLEEMVRKEVAACAGHPAVLCYSLGNEVPASIVRWQGRRRLERAMERLAPFTGSFFENESIND